MSKFIIYGAGLLVVLFVVGLLGFLTIDNMLHSQATFANRQGDQFFVTGLSSLLVNLGILCFISSLISYLAFLYKRSVKLLKYNNFLWLVGGILVFIGTIEYWL